MHAPTLLVTTFLATASSAIQVRLYKMDHCNQAYMGCSSLRPGQCCGDKTGANVSARSALFFQIPTDQELTLVGSAGGACARPIMTEPSKGRAEVCLYRGGFSGAMYGSMVTKFEAMRPEGRECVQPDVIGLGDGVEYDVSSLDNDEFNIMVASTMNATTEAVIPSQFSNLRKSS